MELLEDDYLGGHGVRGSGKVSFKNITVELKPKAYYDKKSEVIPLKKDLDMKGFREVDFVSLIQENLIRTMGL
jgi:CRISPR-associated protein Csm3